MESAFDKLPIIPHEDLRRCKYRASGQEHRSQH